MPREARDITGAELAILRALWKHGRASIRQLTDELHPAGVEAQYATVKKQLERMEAKGLVHRDRSLFVHLFAPAVGREELVGRRLRALADQFCEGSFTPILGFLGKATRLSPEERRALRELIESTDRSAADRGQAKRDIKKRPES